jgi:hypothetical protein
LAGFFGGTDTITETIFNALNDTWEYDGTLWTHVADTGPQARAAHGLVYNGSETLLFGGRAANGVVGGTWSWDGKFWTQRQDLGPSARSSMGMAYDANRKRAVLFGGGNGQTSFGDTWELFARDNTQIHQP